MADQNLTDIHTRADTSTRALDGSIENDLFQSADVEGFLPQSSTTIIRPSIASTASEESLNSVCRPILPAQDRLLHVEDPCERASTTLPFIGGDRNGFSQGYQLQHSSLLGNEAGTLVPVVTVTPERWAIVDSSSTLWAAIEVSSRVSQTTPSQFGQRWQSWPIDSRIGTSRPFQDGTGAG